MTRIDHVLVCLLALGAGALSVHGGEVSSLAKRQETLNLAAQLLAPRTNPAAQLPDDLVNPFDPGAKAIKNSAGQMPDRPPASSDRETLEKIASSIKASGMMMLRGQPLLLVHEKKLRVGDDLKIKFEGFDYVVVVTAIEPTSFSLRLNREEVTRPIKPGKKIP
jgi:hypothetical protein